MITILPSVFAADLMNLKRDLLFLEEQGFQAVHVDMMDGHFVPNLAFGPSQIEVIKHNTSLKLEVHMMVDTPERLLASLIELGVDKIFMHYEATLHPCYSLQRIRAAGIKAGIAYNPSTALNSLTYVLDHIDAVLIMSVNPGHAHQSFYPSTYQRIHEVKQCIGQSKFKSMGESRLQLPWN